MPGSVGGGGGIRTHETLSGLTVFKTAGFNRSPTPPAFFAFSLPKTVAQTPYGGHVCGGQRLHVVLHCNSRLTMSQ